MGAEAEASAMQLAVPVVVSPLISATASGPQSVVVPSLKVTVALRMSPGCVSPNAGDDRAVAHVARSSTLADEPPDGVNASMSPV